MEMKKSQYSGRNSELLDAIRRQFPRAGTDATGRRRVFFENGAGSLVLGRAAEAEAKARLDYFPNVGEASWESKMVEETIVEGRKAIRDFLNAPSENCIVSGESATSLLFCLSYALSKEMPPNANVVTTEYDHYANISPWLELERRGVIQEVRLAKFNISDGILDLDDLARLIDSNTRVVAVAGVSNALGSKTPLRKVAELANKVGAYVVVDAVHMTPHIPIDVQKVDCDFLVFSAYKLFSRRGSFMYGRKALLEKITPYKVDPCSNHAPVKWEMGTRDQALFASITAVMDYLSWLGMKVEEQVSDRIHEYAGRPRLLKAALSWIEEYERTLSKTMLDGISDIPGMCSMRGVELYGLKDATKSHLRTPTFSFNMRGVDPKTLAEYLWKKHSVVCIADDFYSRALKTYDVPLAVRASLIHCNTIEEASSFLYALADAAKHFNES